MSQFEVLTILYQMCEYSHSFSRISHKFCVFDLDQNFLFFYFKLSFRAKRTITAPLHSETRNALPTILEIIDISHDRFLAGNMAERSTSRV